MRINKYVFNLPDENDGNDDEIKVPFPTLPPPPPIKPN